MRYKTFRRYSSLTRALARVRPERHPVVAFDVFDTLLFRRVQPPERVVHAVCRELREKLLIEGIRKPMDEIIRSRFEAFDRERRRSEADGGDSEALLRAVVPGWLGHLAPDRSPEPEWTEWVVQRELELETLATFPNRELLACAKALKESGVRLVYVSDMYLGKEIIEPLLERNGFGGLFSVGYVSGDYGRSKRTGRLFRVVLEREGLRPGQLLHVGDNRFADAEVPAGAGIRCWLMRMNRDRVSRQVLRDGFHLADVRREFAGFLADDFARVRVNEPLHPLEELGFAVYGPIYGTYLLRLCERARAEGVNRVYFATREGFTLRRMYEHLAPVAWPAGRQPRGDYLYVSRKSLLLPNARYPDLSCARQIDIAFRKAPRTLRTLLQVLQLEGNVPEDVLRDCGFQSENDELPEDWAGAFPLLRLLDHEEFLVRFRNHAKAGRQELLRYLREVGFFGGGKAYFANVGWHGREFEGLANVVSRLPDAPQMDCFFLGLYGAGSEDANPRYRFRGLLSHQGRLLWNANSIVPAAFTLENPLRSPHGSTHGYEGGRPVLDSPEHPSRRIELEYEPAVAMLQSGILRYGAELTAFCRLTGYGASAFSPLARSLLASLGLLPAKDVASFWMNTVMDMGVGTTASYSIRNDRLRRRHLLNPLSFRRRLARNFWGGGAVAEIGIPGLSSLYAGWLSYRTVQVAAKRPASVPDEDVGIAHLSDPPVESAERVELPWERERWESFIGEWRTNLERGRCLKCSLKDRRRTLGVRSVLAQESGRMISNILCGLKKLPRYPRDGVSVGSAVRHALQRVLRRLARCLG